MASIVRRSVESFRFPRPFLDYSVERRSMVRRGTTYAGWWFEPSPGLEGGLVVSAGAGEDISFDVALASEFQASVIIIDPTPRAVDHVEAVLQRVGQAPTGTFCPGGKQDPTAYDLSRVQTEQIQLLRFALWNQDADLRFHPPLNPDHVSYTVENWRREPSADSPAPLHVEGRRLSTLLSPAQTSRIELLKIDIEGAEIEVLHDILGAGLRPNQILVEFDQLSRPTADHRKRAKGALRALAAAGYYLAHREALNFSFVQAEFAAVRTVHH